MKKFFLLSLLSFSFAFISCEDDSTDPLPTKEYGQFVKLDIDNAHKQLDMNDISNTYFGGVISTPSNNIVKYEITVRRKVGGVLLSDYVPLMTITSFPYDLKITPQMLADATGVTVADLGDGDIFRFYGYSYDANGNVATYRNLSALNKTTPTIEQGYRFNTELTTTPDAIYNNRNPQE